MREAAAFKSWVKRRDAEGLAGPCRSQRTPSILPEGVDESEENLRRELIRTRFARRALDPTPKFVRERLARAEGARRSGIGTSGPLMA